MRDAVSIRMMGEFVITVNGHETNNLVSKSRKGVALMQYLILNNGKQVPKQRLVSLLWSGYQHSNPESSLKVMVSRLRKILNDLSPGLGECIQSERGAYRWVVLPGMHIDLLEIIDIFEKLAKTDPASGDRTELFERLLKLYLGDLFLTGDISNGSEYEAALHNEYLDAVYEYVEILLGRGMYSKIIAVCSQALKIDEFDERLHMEMMQAQVRSNRLGEAMEQYRKVNDMNAQYLDAQPSEEMQSFYANIVQSGKALRFSLDNLKSELVDGMPKNGAFVCECEDFLQICRLFSPTLERLGCSMFLGLIMLGELDENDKPAKQAELDELIESLLNILQGHLRRGDVVTRYTNNIVAIMLPTVNYTTSNMVMERIRQIFLTQHPDLTLPFHYRLGELGQI